MCTSAPPANTSEQIQRQVPSRSQAPDGADWNPTASAHLVDFAGSARHLPRRGNEDERTQQDSFIDLTGDSSEGEDSSHIEDSILAEDDVDADTDDESEDGSSNANLHDHHIIPDAIRDAERVAEGLPSGQPRSYKVGWRYIGFLENLCIDTATEMADQHTRAGLPYAIETAKSISLDNDVDISRSLDIYAFALVIHIWQLVCLRLQNGEYPFDDVSVSTEWSSYFLSAHVLVEEHRCRVSVSEIKFATQYWEGRLREQGKGISWLQARWAKDIEQTDQDPDFSRNATADRYLQTLDEYGLTALTGVIMEESVKIRKSEQTQLAFMAETAAGSKEARGQMASMFRSMNKDLLVAIIQGQVPRLAAWESGEVFDALWRINEGEGFDKPGIYLQSICDEAGFSPSVSQWLEITDLMIVYIGDDNASEELATEVDQIIHPDPGWSNILAARGLRRYMDRRSYFEKGRNEPDRHHRKMVRYFVDQLRKRLQNETLHAPMKVPVVELGFSNRPDRRLKQHRHHESSNYLMNLAEALFKYKYPGMFRLLQRVIYQCFRPVQAWMSEIVFTLLAQGYVDGAGGFSHEPAGRSNGSSFKTLSIQEWEGLEEEVLESGAFIQSLQEEDAAVAKRLADTTKGRDDVLSAHQAQLDLLRAQKRRLDLERRMLEMLAR